MKITIREVEQTRKGLKPFIDFQKELFKNEPLFVPSLDDDEYNTLLPSKNNAFEFCEAAYWLAYDENENIVGRIAGIINHKANKIWSSEKVRFGWIDFIEDIEVAKALLETVEEWGRSKGMKECVGPLGFMDMDKEGMMVDGFDKEGTFTTIWNWAYYPEFLEKLGYRREADWVQDLFRLDRINTDIYQRLGPVILKRANVHTLSGISKRDLVKKYGRGLFHCCNEAFKNLYEYSPLSDEQIDEYVKQYMPFADMRLLSIVVDNDTDNVVGFAFTFPSMSKAYRKANGSLLRGLFHMLKALHTYDTIEMLMIGVLPEYQAKGITAIMFNELYENYKKLGVKQTIANPRLATNSKVLGLFDQLSPEHYMTRSCFIREI